MINATAVRISTLVSAALLLGLTAVPAWAQGLPAVWQNWLTQLTSAGYGVTQGSATVTSVAYCQQVIVPVFGTCFNSDPGDPYVVPLMPAGAGYIDPYFGGFENQTLPNGTVVGQGFRLANTEAELVIVQLPPQAGYFSFQGYVFTRPIADYTKKVNMVSPDPARADLYASYNNSINNTDILRQSGLTFGQGYVAFITTANSSLAADMGNQFAAVGGNPNLLFTDEVGSIVHTGLDASADDFSMLLRYLAPQDATAGSNWLNNPANNVFVYRIDQPAGLATTPYGATPLLNRSYNTKESVYDSNVAELTSLMKGWLATQETASKYKVKTAVATMKASSTGVPKSGSVGPICIANANLCNGDEQDAIHWSVAVGKIPANDLFIMDGVNTTATNNTTVFSLALEDAPTKTGVVTINQTNPGAAGFNSGDVTGSAELALMTLGLWSQASPALQAAAPYLYVQIFTRGCTAQQVYCGQPFTTVVPSSVIPYADGISVFQRAYALPGYNGGPNPTYVLAPNAIY
jgi:hypothetical protein